MTAVSVTSFTGFTRIAPAVLKKWQAHGVHSAVALATPTPDARAESRRMVQRVAVSVVKVRSIADFRSNGEDARQSWTRALVPRSISLSFIVENVMNPHLGDVETVVRHHLQVFVEQQGLDAILGDYADDACFLSETRAYCGKPAIREFFEGFLAALPPQAVSQFTLRSLRAQGDVAYITWSAGAELPLGTDTFVVKDGRIVAQTFTMVTPDRN